MGAPDAGVMAEPCISFPPREGNYPATSLPGQQVLEGLLPGVRAGAGPNTYTGPCLRPARAPC